MKKYIKKNKIKIHLKNPDGWDEHDVLWNFMYNELLKYKSVYDDCNVPLQKPDGVYIQNYKKLYLWVKTQRTFNNHGKLSEYRKNKLIEIGFDFSPFDTRWEKNFKKLVEFKQIYGHCNVPQNRKEVDSLAVWVNKQRDKRNKLSDDKKQRLLDIGFDFMAMTTLWDVHYNELIDYKMKYGNCSISPRKPGYKNLAKWVSRMRIYKSTSNRAALTEEHEKKLTDLGVEWQPWLDNWEGHYEDLKNFYKAHGHCYVERSFDGRNVLGRWVVRQRKIKSKLSIEKIEKLNQLAFEWDCEVADAQMLAIKKKKKS